MLTWRYCVCVCVLFFWGREERGDEKKGSSSSSSQLTPTCCCCCSSSGQWPIRDHRAYHDGSVNIYQHRNRTKGANTFQGEGWGGAELSAAQRPRGVTGFWWASAAACVGFRFVFERDRKKSRPQLCNPRIVSRATLLADVMDLCPSPPRKLEDWTKLLLYLFVKRISRITFSFLSHFCKAWQTNNKVMLPTFLKVSSEDAPRRICHEIQLHFFSFS